jgi:hypothetical protein
MRTGAPPVFPAVRTHMPMTTAARTPAGGAPSPPIRPLRTRSLADRAVRQLAQDIGMAAGPRQVVDHMEVDLAEASLVAMPTGEVVQ